MRTDRCKDYTSSLTAAYNRILLEKLIVVQLVQNIFPVNGIPTVFSATRQGLVSQLHKLEEQFMSAFLDYLFNTQAAAISPYSHLTLSGQGTHKTSDLPSMYAFCVLVASS
jgi:hypothetical protein